MSEPESPRELLWLRRLRDLSLRLAAEKDPVRLLPLIVDAAIELSDAERGFLVLVSGHSRSGRPKLKVEAARGFAKETLQGGMTKVSRTVVERVLERKGGLVTSREEDQSVRYLTSVQKRRVLSISCVPLMIREQLMGVLYLDNRFNPDAFTEADLPNLMAFAEQAALALSTARLESDLQSQRAKLGKHQKEVDAIRTAGELGAQASARTLPTGEQIPRFGALVGDGAAMRHLFAEIERAARSNAPVLIWGESGAGKELVARELHRLGPSPMEPFFAENCAAVADSVLESELFGHAKGAFTGADTDKAGLFQLAEGGTLFLDEVADMSNAMQVKLLRVLQEGRVRRVGAAKEESVHCRVLVASHHDLRDRVAQGLFREDLFYRLDVLRISVPALRKRPEDLPYLLGHILEREGKPELRFTPEAMELLLRYHWPGNVRELENEVRRLVAHDLTEVGPAHLSPELRGDRPKQEAAPVAYGGKTLQDVESAMIAEALRRTGGNKSQAARELGIAKTTLYRLIERHGL